MSSPANPEPGDILVPRLDLSAGAPDPSAIATWHMALSNLVGNEIPHQLLGVWLMPVEGGPVLLGPAALAQDRIRLPECESSLTQDQLFDLEETLRQAKYASAVAIPVRGDGRDVGVALLGTFEPGAYGPAQIRRMRQLGHSLRATLEPLSQLIRGKQQGESSMVAPPLPHDQLPGLIARIAVESPTATELIRELSGLLHAHIPHDRLEVLAYTAGPTGAVPLSGTTTKRRWGTGANGWGDLVRLFRDLLRDQTTVTVSDLATEAPGLAWPSSTACATSKIASVLAAQLEIGGAPIGLLLLGHAATDVYRPTDEELIADVARLVSARVTALRLEGEAEALRGQLEVLRAPSLPVLRAAESLATTAHLGEALQRFGQLVGEVVPHERIRYLLRWTDTEVVVLTPEAIRPLPDLPLATVESSSARFVLQGDRTWIISPNENGEELVVSLRVADRPVGAMVVEAKRFGSARDAAAALQQFAAVLAPHLELIRRGSASSAVKPNRPSAEPARRPGG